MTTRKLASADKPPPDMTPAEYGTWLATQHGHNHPLPPERVAEAARIVAGWAQNQNTPEERQRAS